MEENARVPDCPDTPQPYPWLVYFHGEDRNTQTFCTVSDPTKTYSRNIPELRSQGLWVLQHGWCLLCKTIANVQQLVLWNPCTLERISLPDLERNGQFIVGDCILSLSPAYGHDCMVLLFSDPGTSIFYCCLGQNQWTKVDYREQKMRMVANLEGNTTIRNPVYCRGRLYAKSDIENLLVEIEKGGSDGLNVKSTHVRLPKAPSCTACSLRKLIESKGELFQIEILFTKDLVSEEIVAIVVHRLNFSWKIWEKVESIKDRVFFLSSVDASFACSAINQETEGGRIYFTMGGDFMYIYNIEDKSLMVSRPFSNLSGNRYCHPKWLMPCRRMADSPTNATAPHLVAAKLVTERLNIVDYLNFRATNRLFWSAAPPIRWRSASDMPGLHDLSYSPLFVCLEKDSFLSFVHPNHGLKYKYSINFPDVIPSGRVICSSKNGWLLLSAGILLAFFLNPFTKEVVPLANWPRAWINTRCVGFSHPPPSSECVVVEFDNNPPMPRITAYITRLGERNWLGYLFENPYFPHFSSSPTFFHGEFYYLGRQGNLGVLRGVHGQGVTWENPTSLRAPCTDYCKSFLMEWDGSLLSVFEGPFGTWVKAFRLDVSERRWIKVEDLGNHMLFVSHTSSFSAVAKIPGMENKIYFPRFYGQSIVFYSMKTKKYHTFDNMDEEVDFHCTREQLHCSWIEPRLQNATGSVTQ